MSQQIEHQSRYLNRIPLTIEEIRTRLDARFEQDELRVLRQLGDHASVSGGVFGALGINRTVVREVLEALSHSRALQATFCSVICATRFKYFRQGALLPTVCHYCGGMDSLAHLQRCVNIGDMPLGTDDESKIHYLVELTKRACNVNPGLPEPFVPDEEVDLTFPQQSDSEGDGDPLELAFEDDAMEGTPPGEIQRPGAEPPES